MNRYLLVAILVAVWGLSAGAAALQQQQQKPLNVRAIQKIRDNLYFISGGELNERATWTGGNSMVLVARSFNSPPEIKYRLSRIF